MKQTKPAQAMELRSLSPVLGGLRGSVRGRQAKAALDRGEAFFFAKPPQLAEAASAFREAASLAPRSPEPLGWLAGTLERLGELPAAVAIIKKALQLDPSDSRHWISLGAILVKRHHWREAIRALERGLDLRPAYAEADARLFLAEAYVGAGRRKDAERQWKLVASMPPCYPSGDKPMREALRRMTKPPNKGMKLTKRG